MDGLVTRVPSGVAPLEAEPHAPNKNAVDAFGREYGISSETSIR